MSDRVVDLAFLCAAAAIPVLIPMLIGLLFHCIGAIRDARLRGLALTLAQAAQQTIPATSDRYAWAAGELARRYPALKADQVQALIEAAVHQVKAATPVAVEAVPGVVYSVRDIDPDEDETQ